MTQGNSSLPHTPSDEPFSSPENLLQPSRIDQPSLFTKNPSVTPGEMDDERTVRGTITTVIRNSAKSRDQIADEMSALMGSRITVRMLNSYTSDAAEQHRWPLQFTRAFCHVVQDWTLLRCIIKRSGFHLITDAEYELLLLGREYLRQKRAAAQIDMLEKRLRGMDL